MRALAVLLGALCLTATVLAGDDAPLPEVSSALARIKDGSNIEITTTGRKTGKPHTRPIWYVVDDGKVLVQSGKDGKTDWYQNVKKTPAVTLKADRYTFRARGRLLTIVFDCREIRLSHAGAP